MDDFLRCLTEQAHGNVYKKVINEQNPAFGTDPMGGGPVDPNMGGDMGMDDMGMDMNMPNGEDGPPESQGIQLTGEQVAMLNQDLQGIKQAMERIQSVLGGEIAPMSQPQDDMGMGGDMGNMGGMDMGMDDPTAGPVANMMARYSRKFMNKR